jgi:hypothetical protein
VLRAAARRRCVPLLVGPVAGDDHQPLAAETGEQERQQVAHRIIGDALFGMVGKEVFEASHLEHAADLLCPGFEGVRNVFYSGFTRSVPAGDNSHKFGMNDVPMLR